MTGKLNIDGSDIFGECAQIIMGWFRVLINFSVIFCLLDFSSGEFSVVARRAAFGELATIRIEFLPPNELGT